MSKLAQNLRTLRDKHNYKQKDVASSINISANTYGNYERGSRQPDFDTLSLLADFYNTTPTELLGIKSPEDIGVKDIEEILINDDLKLTLGEHTISKEDRKVILDILKTYYKSTKLK